MSKTRLIRHFVILIAVIAAGLYVIPALAVDDNTGATIRIPSIDVEAPILNIHIRSFPNGEVTWDTSMLTSEVGFLEGMSWFGQGGNIVLGGHSELANRVPAVFYELDEVRVGDEILINDNGVELRYRVTRTDTVSARDLSILYPTRQEQLTIMTCDTTSLANGSYARRVVVIARRV